MESSRERWSKFIHKRMPILSWLPKYDLRRDLKYDIIAGFTVCVMLVPQEMSLAALMGVPAQYGLYTAATAPLIYPIFGSSRALSVANAAEGSLLVSVLLQAAEIKSMEERVATGILLTFFSGAIMIICGLMHQGGAVSYFSRTSMNGYVTATAFLIVISQLPPWLGISLTSSQPTIFTIIEIVGQIPHTNVSSFCLGLVSLAVLSTIKWCKQKLQSIDAASSAHQASSHGSLEDGACALVHHDDTSSSDAKTSEDEKSATMSDEEDEEVVEISLGETSDVRMTSATTAGASPWPFRGGSRRQAERNGDSVKRNVEATRPIWNPRVLFLSKLVCDAGSLIVCTIGIVAGAMLGPDRLRLTGTVPSGLPMPVFPPAYFHELIPLERFQPMVTNSAMIAIVFFMSSVATGSKIAIKDGYEISPNQELLGLGFANLGASFLQGMPSTAGMSRSAVNSQSAHTPLASMITAAFTVLAMLFLTGPLYYLPQAPLAAIILLSAITLLDFSEAKWLYRVRKQEFYVWIVAFWGTLLTGLLQGLVVSVAASLLDVMVRSKKPPVLTLGQATDGSFDELVDAATGKSSSATEISDMVIVRVEQALYFGNASHFVHAMERTLQTRKAHGRMLGVVIDGSRTNDIDATAMHSLLEYQTKLRKRDQFMVFSNMRQETYAALVASGLVECVDSEEPPQSADDIASAMAHLRRLNAVEL